MEVNYRAVYASRSIGHGYAGLEKFCGVMNIPRIITYNNGESAKVVSECSMKKAVKDLKRNTDNDKTIDIGISVDGTWQKRGYVSLNGIVAAASIDSGKIIDIEVMSKMCKVCENKQEIVSSEEFKTWYKGHEQSCSANYEESAPMMEVAGAVRIFNRSIEERGVRYTSYYGDGDSKAFITVKNT